VAGLALALAGGALYWSSLARAVAPPPVWQRVTFRRGVPTNGRFAPDGRTILYGQLAGRQLHLYSTRLDSPESTLIPIPSATLFAVAPDGRLALGLDHGETLTLALASLAGGGAREVLQDAVAADFSPDGARLAAIHRLDRRDVVEMPPGTPFFDPGPDVRLVGLRFSRRGDRLAVIESRDAVGPYVMRIVIVDTDGKAKPITDDLPFIRGIAWSARGDELWFTAQIGGSGGMALYAATPDGRQRLVQTVPGLVRVQDILPDGRTLLLHSRWPTTMICRAPGAKDERDLSWLDFSMVRDLTDDGRTALFTEDGVAWGGSGAVYLRPLDGGDAVRLGEGEARGMSRDGKWVVAQTSGAKTGFVLLPTGAGRPQSLAVADGNILQARFTADSQGLILRVTRPGEPSRIFRRTLASDELHPVASGNLYLGPVHPDGTSILVETGEGWALLALDGSGTLRPVGGLEPGDAPRRFDAAGRALFVARGDLPTEVRRLDLATGKSTSLYSVGPQFADDLQEGNGLALSADASAYCYSYLRDTSDLYVVDGLR
jgi:dipeptidyl aminopeptidase/acylaminoacyl peptidase